MSNTKSKNLKYRKRPVVVEAYRTYEELDIETLEGTMHASVGDYVITGVRGEQYPCKPDVFRETYELATDDEATNHGYRHDDVTQAVVAALMFGENAGLGAMAAHEAGRPGLVFPGCGNVLHVSDVASRLLAEGQIAVIEAREAGDYEPTPNRINHFYMQEPDMDEAPLVEFGEGVTPGNTDEVYRDQPIPKREA